jgi:hypothetical protein
LKLWIKHGRSAIAVLFLASCSHCSSDKSTGPPSATGPVASIAVSAGASSSMFIGASITLTASAHNAAGAPLTGQTFAWSSSNPLVASVSATGVVTGVSAGVASISAAVDTIAGQTTVIVSASAAQLSCSGVTPLSLNVGDVHPLTGLERSSLCIGGGAGTEYALIAFNSSLDTGATASTVALTATSTVAAVNAPTPQVLAGSAPFAAQRVRRDVGFEMRMRAMERRELNPRFAAARAWFANRSRQGSSRRGISAILNVPDNAPVGTLVSLNGNATSACSAPQARGARITAISSHAIVVVDTLAPANGFTTAEYQNFAATFDTLMYPIDTLNFGVPTDIDNNGHVVLFFSPIVNQLSSNLSGSYVGGFFFSRDLFPLTTTVVGSDTLSGCAGSNLGEMFYLPVVDAAQQYNRFFPDTVTVRIQLLSTIVHEFQHLINAGRHLYVNTTSNSLEESWLDETEAMLAQELLYYHVSGFAPKQKLTYATISTGANSNGTQLAITNADLIGNLQDVSVYIQTTESSTPFNNTENIQTLGAGWQFMRYMLDHTSGGAQSTYSRAIDNGLVPGFANLSNVFSMSLPTLAAAYQSWAIAQYVDGTGLTSNPAYSNPSWNFRSVLEGVFNQSEYQLVTRPLLPASPVSVPLRGGGASYMRFRVNPGVTAQIVPTGNAVASTAVTYALVRTF